MQAESKISIHQLSVRIRKPCVVAVHILRNTWRKEDWKRMRTSFQATLNVLHGYLFYSITVSDLGKKKKKEQTEGFHNVCRRPWDVRLLHMKTKSVNPRAEALVLRSLYALTDSQGKVSVCPSRRLHFRALLVGGNWHFTGIFFFFVANAKIFFFLFFFAHTWGHMDYLRK